MERTLEISIGREELAWRYRARVVEIGESVCPCTRVEDKLPSATWPRESPERVSDGH